MRDFMIQAPTHELRQLHAASCDLGKHLRFLGEDSNCLDARDVLRLSSELRREVARIRCRAAICSQRVRSAARSAGPPPRELTPGRFSPSAHGRVADARAWSRKVQAELNSVQQQLDALGGKASRRLNDPGRWGDAAVSGIPMVEVVRMFNEVMKLLVRVGARIFR